MRAHDFGWAIAAMKEGKKVARTGWNGKNMFVFLGKVASFCPAGTPEQVAHAWGHEEAFAQADIRECIFMKDAQGMLVPGWLASQTDMLADDWDVVE